jgi:hypothetical protein
MADDLFAELKNLYTKEVPLRSPEDYNSVIFMVNRFLSMDNSLLPVAAEFSKYLYSLGGRCYHLWWGFIKQGPRPYTPYVKKDKLMDEDAERVRHLKKYLNCNGVDAYASLLILKKQGIDVDRYFGIDVSVKKKDKKTKK